MVLYELNRNTKNTYCILYFNYNIVVVIEIFRQET